MTARPTMTIDGKAAATAAEFEVLDPATEQVVGLAPDCTPAQLDEAMESARAAFPAWSRDRAARSQALKAAAERLVSVAGEAGALLCAEQGGLIDHTIGQVAASAEWLTYYADLELPTEVVHDTPDRLSTVVRRPFGPVAAITPWNAPILLAMWKISAGLAAGNTMVLKPSPYTPLATLVVGAALNEVLPPGVLNIISGQDPLGRLMVEHPVPRKVSVTGSIGTGRAVAASAAAGLKRVALELGGNDPAILLPDADVDAIVDELFLHAFNNCGQICAAIKRIYVPEELYARVVDRFTDRARALRVGPGTDSATDIGPLTTAFQRDHVERLVDDAVRRGGEATAGGHRVDGPGYFYQPTVVRGVGDGVPLVDEEQFGPAIPIVAYSDLDAVVERCNAGEHGLTASVWSTDEERALAVAQRLEVGTAKVNGHGGFPLPSVPFGGHKSSGLGVENGRLGLEAYTQVQVVDVYRPGRTG